MYVHIGLTSPYVGIDCLMYRHREVIRENDCIYA